MKSCHGAPWLLLALLITALSGCEGGQTRPIMDYAPENVEDIRKAQGLEPAEEEAAEDTDQASEDEAESESEDE